MDAFDLILQERDPLEDPKVGGLMLLRRYERVERQDTRPDVPRLWSLESPFRQPISETGDLTVDRSFVKRSM
jgi:hypothetical protein